MLLKVRGHLRAFMMRQRYLRWLPKSDTRDPKMQRWPARRRKYSDSSRKGRAYTKSSSSHSDRSSLIECRIFFFCFSSRMKLSRLMWYRRIHRTATFWFFWMNDIMAFPKFFGMFFVSLAVDRFKNLLQLFFYYISNPSSTTQSPFYQLGSSPRSLAYVMPDLLPSHPPSLAPNSDSMCSLKIPCSSSRLAPLSLAFSCSQQNPNSVGALWAGLSWGALLKQRGRGQMGRLIALFSSSPCCIFREF